MKMNKLTRAQQARKLVDHFGYKKYCEMAFERFVFPFTWYLSGKGEIVINKDDVGNYLKSETDKGLSIQEIIERDKRIQDEAMDMFYNEVFQPKEENEDE